MKTLRAYHVSTQISDNTFFKHTCLAKGISIEGHDMLKVWETGDVMLG